MGGRGSIAQNGLIPCVPRRVIGEGQVQGRPFQGRRATLERDLTGCTAPTRPRTTTARPLPCSPEPPLSNGRGGEAVGRIGDPQWKK
jgi:hypothetical protein